MKRYKAIALVPRGDRDLCRRWFDRITGRSYVFPLDHDPNHHPEDEPEVHAVPAKA